MLLRCASRPGWRRAPPPVVDGDDYADVRCASASSYYQQAGISSVPSVIVNERYLIQGGQPPELFEQSLREIAAEA